LPEEAGRTTKRKRVLFPGEDPEDPDAAGVNCPVITRIVFVDPVKRAQEYEYTIDNSAQGDREVHVDNVYPEADTGSDPLLVERIDKWRTVDAVARGQESELTWDNRTGGDSVPPSFTTHQRTHVVRYKNDPDDGNWIDSELIDEFVVVDAVDRGQESRFTLLHPQGQIDEEGKEVLLADQTDPEISDTANGIDPAWRTDPFQNIVDWSGGGVYVLFLFSWHDFLTQPIGERCTLTQNIAVPGPLVNTFTPGIPTRAASAEAVDIVCSGSALDSLLNGATDTGGQPETITTARFAQNYWKFPPCFNCATNLGPVIWYPPGDPHGGPPAGFNYCSPEYSGPTIFADPVPYTGYERSFLFDIPASNPDEDNPTAGNSATTRIEFDIFGLPEPRLSTWIERTLPTYPGGPGAVPFSFAEMNQNTVCQLSFTVYVFNKSAVDLYLTDKVFPLRKKGIIPTVPDAVDQTKAVRTAIINSIAPVNTGWTDEGNMLHESLSDADVNTAESGTYDGEGGTGSETVNLRFHFEKFKVGPGHINPSIVSRSLAWPVEPDGQVVAGVIARAQFDGAPVFGPIHNRRYFWNYVVNGVINSVIDEAEKDFGQQPMPPPTA